MNDYELLYIVSGGLPEADATKVTDEVGSVLVKLGGKAADENVWGRRALAYPIGKDDHGWYVVTRFAIDPAKLDEFSKALTLNRKVIRTVLLKAEEVPSPEEAKKVQEATEQAEKTEAEEKAAARKAPGVKARATKSAPAPEVPDELKKTAPKPAPPAKNENAAADLDSDDKAKKAGATPTEPADDATRQKQLDEKLGEILKD